MPRPTIISYSIKDSMGTTATMPIYVSYDAATETVEALIGAAAAFGGLTDLITDGKITEFNILINALPDPSWKANPVADSIVERTANANFLTVDSPYPEPIDVPAISLSVLDAKGRVDLANTNWVNWRTQITSNTGIGASTTVFAQNKFLIALKAFKSVATTFRKHKKPVKAETFETP